MAGLLYQHNGFQPGEIMYVICEHLGQQQDNRRVLLVLLTSLRCKIEQVPTARSISICSCGNAARRCLR